VLPVISAGPDARHRPPARRRPGLSGDAVVDDQQQLFADLVDVGPVDALRERYHRQPPIRCIGQTSSDLTETTMHAASRNHSDRRGRDWNTSGLVHTDLRRQEVMP